MLSFIALFTRGIKLVEQWQVEASASELFGKNIVGAIIVDEKLTRQQTLATTLLVS